jgi:hypothetical protein
VLEPFLVRPRAKRSDLRVRTTLEI